MVKKSSKITINSIKYKDVTDAMQAANDRCKTSSRNCNFTFDSSKSGVISDYAGALKNLKSILGNLGEQVDLDLGKFNGICDNLEAFDTAESQKYRLPTRGPKQPER